MQPHHGKAYYFRLECENALKWTFKQAKVTIEVTDNFPSPTLTPSTLEVKEGDSVSPTCSAPAPCLPHPPNLTWTPTLGDTQETLQENQDKTLERDLSTLQCFGFNSLGSASKQFCVSCLESSIENQGQFPKPIFIITVTAFLLNVCSLLFVVGFQKTRYKPQRIAGEPGTVATGQRLMKKKNEVPNPNVDDFVEYGQSENVQPSSGTAVNCTSSLITHIPEETSRSSGVKSEDMVYASVIWSKKKKKKRRKRVMRP
ncbi:hypothetical protein ILYODFUR_027497 [Ilyodon furcidens]|uniref:Ig-like domain-containing protein n=1 Tax=Ilyodon furcidens TaxID=33524 RepID=A0ABV0U2D3_9TELE